MLLPIGICVVVLTATIWFCWWIGRDNRALQRYLDNLPYKSYIDVRNGIEHRKDFMKDGRIVTTKRRVR